MSDRRTSDQAARDQGAPEARELFSPRVLTAVIAVGIIAFVAMFYLELFGDEGDPDFEIGPSTYSSSAIGHKALLETLRGIDILVVVSRFRTDEKARTGGVLVLAEPRDGATAASLLDSLGDVPRSLLVLPKWGGSRDPAKPRWVGEMALIPVEAVRRVLEQAKLDATVQRGQGTTRLDVPEFGGKIELANPQVLTDTPWLKPIVSLNGGILIGEAQFGSGKRWVLSDPDLISNHGIDEGDNAVVAVSMIEHLRAGGVVIFDETIHGFEQRPNLLTAAFELPFSMVTLSAAIAVLLAIWAGMSRFGRPEPAARALQPGKITLIRTTADLLHQASRRSGAVDLVLARYLRTQIADMVARLNGPHGLDDRRQIIWLDDLAGARRMQLRLRPIVDAIESSARSGTTESGRALRLAADLNAWKQEYLHGLGQGSIDR
jgi:hypothetical protein